MNFNNLVQLSTQQNYKQLKQTIEQAGKLNIDDNIWNALIQYDMNTHSLLYLLLLKDIQINQNNLFNIDRLLKSIDCQQIKEFGVELVALIKKYYEFMQKNNAQIKSLRALQIVLNSINKASIGITTAHVYFLKTCIDFRFYNLALPIIQYPQTNILHEKEIDIQEIFMYYYYSGNILSVLKHFDDAQRMYEFCFYLKQKNFYEIHLEAKKKTILLEIRKGDLNAEPFREMKGDRGFSKKGQDSKIVQIACDDYFKLQSLQNNESVHHFDQFSNKIAGSILEDGNLGLLKQCRFSSVFYNLNKLKKVYQRFRIEDLYSQLKLGKDQISIRNLLIEINKIQPTFTINQKLNCVEFLELDDMAYQSQILVPLKDQLSNLEQIVLEFEKEQNKIVLERIKSGQGNYN